MHRSVVVFDTDLSRASALRAALGQAGNISQTSVVAVNAFAQLQDVMRQNNIDVLFCYVGVDATMGKLVNDVLMHDRSFQVVFTGITEKNLVGAEVRKHAFLLPATFTAKDVAVALDRALALQDKSLELPLIAKTRQMSRTVYPAHVSCIESDLRKVRIHMGEEVVEVYGKLSEMLKKLPRRFVQCHKSFAVNLGYVERLEKEYVVLATGERIPVSQKRRKETRDAFMEYVGRVL